MKWLTRIYTLLLRLYPPDFYDEFGEEMTAVFADAIAEAGKRSSLSLAMVCLRETRDWPGAVWQEHLLARRNTMTIQDENEPLRRGELLAALALFLFIPLAYFLVGVVGRPPQWLDYVLAFVFFGGLMAAFILAITRGLPRWSPPYLGFVLMIGIILSQYDRIWGWIYPYYIRSFGPRSLWSIPVRIAYVGVFEFIMLFSILLSGLILVNLLRLLPYTRGVWQRIRADWTQLSFMLYGGLVFGILIAFDEYRHAELWKLIAGICLALGAWLYLRAKGQKQRILALIGGATGAMWIVALAKWTLIPLQMWPTGYPDAPSETTRWVETGSSIVGWGWILLMLIAPALLNLLPSSPPPTVQEDMAPA
jgi:hypothetical protein